MKKLFAIIATVAYVVVVLVSVAYAPRLAYEKNDYRIIYYSQQHFSTPLQPAEIHAKLSSIIGVHNYTLAEKPTLVERGKVYMFLFYNIVYVRPDLEPEEFARTLAHELMHIKLFSADERYVEFQTFKILYESGDKELKKIAMNIANENLSYAIDHGYDCGAHIKKYLIAHGGWEELLETHFVPYIL